MTTKGLNVLQINENRHGIAFVLCGILLPFTAAISFIGVLCSVFSVQLPLTAVCITSFLSSVLFLIMGILKKKKRIFFAAALFSAVILTFIFMFGSFLRSINAIANEVFCAVGARFFIITPVLEEAGSPTLFFVVLSICCTFCASYAFFRKNLAVPIIFAALILLFSTVMQKANGAYLLLFAFYLLAVIMQKITSRSSLYVFLLLPVFLLLFVNTPSDAFIGIKSKIEDVVYGKAEALPQGDFENLGVYSPSEKAALQITSAAPSPMYLRGFVGAVYNGHGFESIDGAEMYTSADLFYRLHQNGYFAQKYFSLKDGVNVSVTNLGASKKYIYLPYETVDFAFSEETIGDENEISFNAFGPAEYSFTASKNQLDNLEELKIYDDNNELHYRSFAYNTYLSMPEDTRELLKSLLLLDGSALDYTTAKQIIRDFFAKNISYNEQTAFNEKTDFLQYFLEATHSGYSIHYAAAATLMLRACGIPARYVEGFVVTKSDAVKAERDKPFMLTQKNAHAWAEYYLDGVGWVPFETTPQMMEQMPLEQGDAAPVQTEEKAENKTISESTDTPKVFANQTKALSPINFILIFTAVILTAAAVFFIRLFVKHHRLKAFLNKSPLNLFSHTVLLLKKTKVIEIDTDIYRNKQPIYAFIGQNELFDNALFAYEKARYGGLELSKSDEEYIAGLHLETVKKIRRNANAFESLKNRFICCLY